ncbi:MAG: hypothetical protein UH103_04080, partial [Paludibacteraceae bacterium]|nr:hypothetical protein [Paludibacteraceae bacterium]
YLFQEHGIRIIRFENRTLFYNPEGVVESILKVIQKLKENNNKPLRPTDTSPKTGEEYCALHILPHILGKIPESRKGASYILPLY